jgi:hypothetical protein
VTVVAAYRDRWDIGNHPDPLGPGTTRSAEQAQQRQQAFTAARRAVTIARNPQMWGPSPHAGAAHAVRRGMSL